MNIWDILILAAVAALAVLAFRRVRKQKKARRCSCGCEGCAMPCGRKTDPPR